jgi:hypothetical protein
MAIHAGSGLLFVVLARAGEWIVAAPAALDSEGSAKLVRVINTSVGVGLWIAVGISAIELGREFLRWQSWRRRSAGGDALHRERGASLL